MEYWQILTALITLLGAFSVARYNAYRTASAKFRGIVLDALADFYPVFTRREGSTFGEELKSKFPILQSAVTDFEASLLWSRKVDFRKAWGRYCNATGRDCDMNTYLHYFDSYGPGVNQAEATTKAQAIFHTNISRLLSFSHET
jgi:hypothetical protein